MKAQMLMEEFEAEHEEKVLPVTSYPAILQKIPHIPREDMGYCRLRLLNSKEELMASLHAGPQFRRLCPEKILAREVDQMRLIILSESDYYARQAAVHLATLARQRRDDGWRKLREEAESYWPDTEIGDSYDEDMEHEESQIRDSLLVLRAAVLDPSLGEKGTIAVMDSGRPKRFSLAKVDASAVMIYAPTGAVLTAKVLEQIDDLCCRTGTDLQTDIFLTLRQGQIDREYLEELRFRYGFQVCHVDFPDRDYLCRQLRWMAEELAPIRKDADLDHVVASLQRYRGDRFTELDLEMLIIDAIQRGAKAPLSEKDLIFHTFEEEKKAWKELESMVALEEVKEKLHRLLATALLEKRRFYTGKNVRPMCRNLAFSGPPGTGKSVTARLLAQILREEGCGSGRFVEAGREQLIGTHLGQTSPQIAELFKKARGGVLFIDEAGALLNHSEQDSYAVEAVNALVRHMELEPETMVILATYPDEMKKLLASNPGLSSRIAQNLEFHGYEDTQLWEIVCCLGEKNGYQIDALGKSVCMDFFRNLRVRKRETFGNGREARRLFEAAVEELAVRTMGEKELAEVLTMRDFEKAAKRLLKSEREARKTVGFKCG